MQKLTAYCRGAGLLVACFVCLLSVPTAFAGAKQPTAANTVRRPLKTQSCVRKDGAGVCREWDYTYAVAGASCTENCLIFGQLDDCKLRNKCTFDAPSGCFKKRSCVKIGQLDDCATWDEKPACN